MCFFPADFILSSPQGVSKDEIGKIPLHAEQLYQKQICGGTLQRGNNAKIRRGDSSSRPYPPHLCNMSRTK